MELVCSSELLLRAYQITPYHNPEDYGVYTKYLLDPLSMWTCHKIKCCFWAKVVKPDCHCLEYHTFLRTYNIKKYVITFAMLKKNYALRMNLPSHFKFMF